MTSGRPLDAVVEVHRADEALGLLDLVSSLYAVAFAEPPFNADATRLADQRAYFPKVVARPGFRLVLGKEGDEYVGFGYGYVLPADSDWWKGIVEPLDDAFIRETGSRTFAVIDYGVSPPFRGRGFGRLIHDELVGGAGAERATLAVRPTAAETQAIYRHWGWRWVGHEVMTVPGTAPVFDILVLEQLPVAPSAAARPHTGPDQGP